MQRYRHIVTASEIEHWTSTYALIGDAPPAGFVSDGCSMSLDGWWLPACVWHDYAYHRIRSLERKAEIMDAQIATARAEYHDAVDQLGRKHECCQRRRAVIRVLVAQSKRLRKTIRQHRRVADWHLKENIRRCSGVEGKPWRGVLALLIGRWYHRGVRVFGFQAVRAPGLEENGGL